jgi:hypothetical protein
MIIACESCLELRAAIGAAAVHQTSCIWPKFKFRLKFNGLDISVLCIRMIIRHGINVLIDRHGCLSINRTDQAHENLSTKAVVSVASVQGRKCRRQLAAVMFCS